MLRGWVRRLFSHHASNRGPGSGLVAEAARYYYFTFEAARPLLPQYSGELNLLQHLKAFDLDTILDVGGNVGDWAAGVRRSLPDARIHMFELSPPTAERLAQRFADDDHVVVNAMGLSDTARTVQISHFPGASEMSGIGIEIERLANEKTVLEARVGTGQDYLTQQNLTPDMLKVDCEGHDLAVLMGFGSVLDEIPIIQFEFNDMSLHFGQTLKAFYDLLQNHEIGRLYPKGVNFLGHTLRLNLGLPGNFVAVRRDRQDIIDAVRLGV